MGHLFPLKIAPSHGGSEPHLIHGSLGPPKSSTQTASRSVQPFLHSLRQSVVILYNRRPLSPQNCPFPWGSGPSSNTWFPGPTQVLNPNDISIGSAVFAQLAVLSLYFTMGYPFSPKNAPSRGDLDPHLIHGSLGPPESSTQTTFRSVQLFLQGSL